MVKSVSLFVPPKHLSRLNNIKTISKNEVKYYFAFCQKCKFQLPNYFGNSHIDWTVAAINRT